MTIEASLQHNSLAESSPHRPFWSALTRLWSPAATSSEAELGYECALPWTLGEDAPRDSGEPRY
ncbi:MULTISPECIES: hypothetical protein [unclassified Roseateles]|uniref:hypothetical protein n=1 Tax=Pelomonas sp. Root1237 TaxID=1736434 RepID=UPI0006F52B73|nr:hypothetical protein [Pelomonas sp. Root1237]KQV86092.1 hypothetical protein ASC91_23290 [Pelomonas sp. Root1237]